EMEPESEVDTLASDAIDDELTIRAARRHSLAHSAEDAAQLADFLATPHVVSATPDAELPITASIPEASIELSFIEPAEDDQEEPAVEAIAREAEIEPVEPVDSVSTADDEWIAEPESELEPQPESELEPQLESDFEPEPEFEPELEVGPAPEPVPEPKKPGFFARLMWRKS